jgi:Uri superfamily endonuclease
MEAPLISYQLFIALRQPRTITIGRLGEFNFPAGVYVYTGSAKRNIEARIARHCRREKTLRWHIDYLLAAEGVELFCIGRSARRECALNRSVGGEVVVPGFGASDCRKSCGSHLRFLGAQRANGGTVAP